MNFINNFQFMPFVTAAACVLEGECAEAEFPTTEVCVVEVAVGGINELYFIPCTSVMSEANVLDVDWWQDLVDNGKLGRSGLGLGSIGKKSDKKDRVASRRGEQITGITWALKYGIKLQDKTAARTTHAKVNELIANSGAYLVIARMCDGENDVLPIGTFETSDLNWTLPDNSDDNQLIEIELSWQELGIPTPTTVVGLSAVVPKLK